MKTRSTSKAVWGRAGIGTKGTPREFSVLLESPQSSDVLKYCYPYYRLHYLQYLTEERSHHLSYPQHQCLLITHADFFHDVDQPSPVISALSVILPTLKYK